MRARWDDPPDFDDDGLPDAIVAIDYHLGLTTCRVAASDHPCPTPDRAAPGVDGPLTLAFVGLFTGDATPTTGDADVATAPQSGRLLGTRRITLSTTPTARAELDGVEFSEFGPGLVVRTLLRASDTGRVTDAIDVVDVFAGLGLDRRAGTLVHHCVRVGSATPTRSGAIAIASPSLAPLLWRAATSHPYSGCATGVESLDAHLGATLFGGLTIRDITTAPAGTAHRVAIAVENGGARVVNPTDRHAAPWSNPLALGPVQVTDMTRGCQWDHLRYDRDGHHCHVNIPRHDDPLPGCETQPSPLDPEPPLPLWVTPHGGVTLDGGVPAEPLHLVFARGGALWDATLPLACRGESRAHAVPWHGTAPVGVAVSPSGDRVLFGTGDDLWLFTRGRRVPYLLNPPGGALPRLDVRAAAFVDDTHVAVVLSGQFITFELTVPAEGGGVPGELAVDAAEVARALGRR